MEKSNDLTVVSNGPMRTTPCGQRMSTYILRCVCGTQFVALQNNVNRGHTKSCGCLKRRLPTYHGQRGTPIYTSWDCMVQRCCNPKAASYRNYGGRGIRICSAWREFKEFYQWAIVNGWAEGLELDRVDNNGNYEPSNCRWVTPAENNLNKRTNRLITFNGQTKTLKEWGQSTGLHPKTITGRLDLLRWSVADALTTPSRGRYAQLSKSI